MLRYSIIIPAHNSARTLHRCLESIGKMDFLSDKFEIIVVNDRSTDSTEQIALRYGARVIRGSFGCIPEVRNRGVKAARGEVVVHLDSDMIVDRDWLKKADTYFSQGFYGALGFADNVPDDANWIAKAWYDPKRIKSNQLRRVDYLPTRNLFVNKELHEKMGGLDEKLFSGRRGGSDKEFTFRIHKAGFPVINDPSLSMLHLGYEKSILNFIKKEFWHQGNTLLIARKYNYVFRLLKNPLLSLYHLFSFVFLVISPVIKIKNLTGLILLVWISPSLLIVFKRMDFTKLWHKLPSSFFVTIVRWTVSGFALIPQIQFFLKNCRPAPK